MDYLFTINFFVCLPGSKIILMLQWQNKIYNSNFSVKRAQKQWQQVAIFLWAKQERKDPILISVSPVSFGSISKKLWSHLSIKREPTGWASPARSEGTGSLHRLPPAASSSSSLAPWCCHSPGVRTATPMKWTQHWHQDHGRAPRTARDSGGCAQPSIRIISLQDTHVSKPRASVWKGWTPLWHRQWEWQSWETAREKRETEKALEAHFLQSYLHRRGCTGAQGTGLQFAMLFWACLYKALRRHIELIMINKINYPFSI